MARIRIPEVRQVLANLDKTPINERSTTVASNAITITLAAVEGKRHHIFDVALSGTAGTGAAEAITINKAGTAKWTEKFTVGTDKTIHFGGDMGWAGGLGEAVTVVASATNLTAGALSASGYTK